MLVEQTSAHIKIDDFGDPLNQYANARLDIVALLGVSNYGLIEPLEVI